MKEIKFRAWGTDGGKGPQMWDWNHIRGCLECWLLDSSKLMQFTGAVDKKGKEIYEGDILLWQNTQYGADRRCYAKEADRMTSKGFHVIICSITLKPCAPDQDCYHCSVSKKFHEEDYTGVHRVEED